MSESGYNPHCRFLAIDEGRQRLSLVDTDRPDFEWSIDLEALPLARSMQRIGDDRVLVGFDRGYFELEPSSGKILMVNRSWKGVTACWRREDGCTLVTGCSLDGLGGVTVLTVDPRQQVAGVARREGNYVRLMRPGQAGHYLLCTDDHILETTSNLVKVREFRAEGFRHSWMAQCLVGGDILVAGGYGGFMARFTADGALIRTFGRSGEVPDEVAPLFYASFQVLGGDRLLVANWQGHGPGNGAKGRQLVEFSLDGQFRGAWSDSVRISSLQGLLVL